jgi:hypothetical protein
VRTLVHALENSRRGLAKIQKPLELHWNSASE